MKQVLFATGDTLAQQGVEKKGFANHDIARSGRMALYGGGMLVLRLRNPRSDLCKLFSDLLPPNGTKSCREGSTSGIIMLQ